MQMSSRSSKFEHADRVQAVYRLKLMGTPSCIVIQTIMKQYGVSERTVKRDIRDAKALMVDESKRLQAEDHLALLRQEDLYQKAYHDKNWKLCNSINEQQQKMRVVVNGQKNTRKSERNQKNIPDALADFYNEIEDKAENIKQPEG